MTCLPGPHPITWAGVSYILRPPCDYAARQTDSLRSDLKQGELWLMLKEHSISAHGSGTELFQTVVSVGAFWKRWDLRSVLKDFVNWRDGRRAGQGSPENVWPPRFGGRKDRKAGKKERM